MKISVPSAADYNNSLVDGESYLMQDIYFWLSNTKDSKQSYFVNSEKALATDKNNSFGVKPVITLKKKTTVLGGTGTQEDPYTLGDVKKAKPNAKLNTRYAGEYLVLRGNLYRIVDADKDGATKLIGEFSVVDTNEADKVLIYDSEPYIYNPNKIFCIKFLCVFKSCHKLKITCHLATFDSRQSSLLKLVCKLHKLFITIKLSALSKCACPSKDCCYRIC